MEQLSVAATKDNEQVFKLLSDLIHTNKEFQIMITVHQGIVKNQNPCMAENGRQSGIWKKMLQI